MPKYSYRAPGRSLNCPERRATTKETTDTSSEGLNRSDPAMTDRPGRAKEKGVERWSGPERLQRLQKP